MKMKTGAILIVFAFIVSLKPYLLIIALPIFAVGIVFLWRSKKSTKTKTIWTILPIVIWYPSFIIVMSLSGFLGSKYAHKSDYIIPENFTGYIHIVESECGETPLIANNRLQFEIPENGIYLYKGKLVPGYTNDRYFIRNANGELNTLESYSRKKGNKEENTIGIEEMIAIHGERYISYKNGIKVIRKFTKTNKFSNENEIKQKLQVQEILIDSLRAICN